MEIIAGDYRIQSIVENKDLIARVRSKIESLREIFPSDSFVEVKLEQIPSGFWDVGLSIKFSRGHIAIRRFGHNLENTVTRVLNETKDRIELWHSQRNVEPFRLDRTSEFELYSELVELIRMKPCGLDILVVDDDPTSLTLFSKVFDCLGCRVHTRATPDEGLDLLLSSNFDLLILDWNLPYKSGSDFLKEADSKLLAKNSGLKAPERIPVVISSSLESHLIQIPKVESFRFLYPWHKGTPFSSIMATFETTLKNLYRAKDANH